MRKTRAHHKHTPPHLTPEVKRLDAEERRQYYLEEIAPRYRRSESQRRRLPHYILRCEPLSTSRTISVEGYILGFNTLKALLDYLAICHAGVSPPRRGHDHVELIIKVYEDISAMRSLGDELKLDLDQLVDLINSSLEGSCYINIIDLKRVCSADLEEYRYERAELRARLKSRRRGEHSFSRRERVAYLREYYPEVLPPEVS